MSDRFAHAALRLSGLAARGLGWRPDEFWNATPAEIAAIFTPHEPDPVAPLSRTELTTLLERDNDR